MNVASYLQAAAIYGSCPDCGYRAFEVLTDNFLLLTDPPQEKFVLVCDHCGTESQEFTRTVNPAKKKIVVRSDQGEEIGYKFYMNTDLQNEIDAGNIRLKKRCDTIDPPEM